MQSKGGFAAPYSVVSRHRSPVLPHFAACPLWVRIVQKHASYDCRFIKVVAFLGYFLVHAEMSQGSQDAGTREAKRRTDPTKSYQLEVGEQKTDFRKDLGNKTGKAPMPAENRFLSQSFPLLSFIPSQCLTLRKRGSCPCNILFQCPHALSTVFLTIPSLPTGPVSQNGKRKVIMGHVDRLDGPS